MGAKEAPEKIYFGTQQNMSSPFSGLTRKCADTDIEYIRKDAFIEKACGWIKEKWDDNYTMPIIIDSVIEDFKNYMKGE